MSRDERFGSLTTPDFAGYSAHLNALRPNLPPALATISETDLHDALIERLTIDESKQSVALRLLIGDLQRGYRSARIKYRGATLTTHGAELRWLVGYADTEVLADEVDITESGFQHRLLFWPAGEIHISFDTVEFKTAAHPSRVRAEEPRLRCR